MFRIVSLVGYADLVCQKAGQTYGANERLLRRVERNGVIICGWEKKCKDVARLSYMRNAISMLGTSADATGNNSGKLSK